LAKRYLAVTSVGAAPLHLRNESVMPLDRSPIGPEAVCVAQPWQARSPEDDCDSAICASGIAATQPPKDIPRPHPRASRSGEKRLTGMVWFLKGLAIRQALMPPSALTEGNRMHRNAFR
jgi:hypothetical protein